MPPVVGEGQSARAEATPGDKPHQRPAAKIVTTPDAENRIAFDFISVCLVSLCADGIHIPPIVALRSPGGG